MMKGYNKFSEELIMHQKKPSQFSIETVSLN